MPGRSRRENCGRESCFPCHTGSEGVSRKTGVGYEIECVSCENNNTISKYAGESARNLFTRGNDYVREVAKKIADKPLWKHILEKHGGKMDVPMFSHFTMKPVQFFRQPQRRKANKGVRIVHLDPVTRLNSKLEFRQGTNICLSVVMGVGAV